VSCFWSARMILHRGLKAQPVLTEHAVQICELDVEVFEAIFALRTVFIVIREYEGAHGVPSGSSD
jgi:hypothetical protein